MRYMLLIYNQEAGWEAMSREEQGQVFGEFMAFTDAVRTSGHYLGSDRLHPVATATTVRVRDGKALSTDGPFAETKEQLGGYYMVEAKDLDEAIALAARVPGARFGSIEVRPVMEMQG